MPLLEQTSGMPLLVRHHGNGSIRGAETSPAAAHQGYAIAGTNSKAMAGCKGVAATLVWLVSVVESIHQQRQQNASK